LRCIDCLWLRKRRTYYVCLRQSRLMDGSLAKRRHENPCPHFTPKPKKRRRPRK